MYLQLQIVGVILGINSLYPPEVEQFVPERLPKPKRKVISKPSFFGGVAPGKDRWPQLKISLWFIMTTWNPKQPLKNGCLVKQPFPM